MIFKGRRSGETYNLNIELKKVPGLIADIFHTPEGGARVVFTAAIDLPPGQVNGLLAELKQHALKRYPPSDRIDPWECRRPSPGGGWTYSLDQ
jgi:hypothetical protein